MPRASVITAAAVKPGLRARPRIASDTSPARSSSNPLRVALRCYFYNIQPLFYADELRLRGLWCVFRGRAGIVALTLVGLARWSERYASVCCVCFFQGGVASDIRCSFVSTRRTSGSPSCARGVSPACAMRWRDLTPPRFSTTRPTWPAPLFQQPPCSWCEPESSACLRNTSWSVRASGATTSSCRRASSRLLPSSTPLH